MSSSSGSYSILGFTNSGVKADDEEEERVEVPGTDEGVLAKIVNQKSPEVSAPSKQHVPMGLEDPAFNQDAAVAEEVPLALLIELQQQLGQIDPQSKKKIDVVMAASRFGTSLIPWVGRCETHGWHRGPQQHPSGSLRSALPAHNSHLGRHFPRLRQHTTVAARATERA
ncbi:hypothetical protein EYF80_001580 [Liparis tanakae]|uniref:Uncharacterized protein n=1 Tax=Liparis tanakae TaxID=230148 RepID=A0A4Z2JCR0_9TELE|nr:hypothetical protein EYF80_001580 [Liparis tanakae]